MLSVARYELRERLGAGAMGVVYRAWDPELERDVAIKLLNAGRRSSADRFSSQRLLREAQAMARLAHPNVVDVYDVGSYDEEDIGGIDAMRSLDIPARGVFIVMDYVRGHSLRQWLMQPSPERRPWWEIVDMFVQAARGLAAAHDQGLVHRDFKPDNAIIGADGRLRVLDFGLAHRVGEGDPSDSGRPVESIDSVDRLSTSLTQTGALVGTPRYMAPEQHQLEGADARSDQYAFCAALYEAMWQRKPFDGETVDALAVAKLSPPPQPPSRPTAPSYLWPIVRRGLDPDPDARFEDMHRLVSALLAGRRRSRRAGVVGLAVVVAGSGVMAGLISRGPTRVCGGAGEEPMAEVWNPATRAEVERRFEASGLPYAPDSLRTLLPRIDAYAERWREQARTSCRAAEDETISIDVERQLQQCLERRREGLVAFIDVLTGEEAAAIENAVVALAQLPDPGGCTTASSGASLPALSDEDLASVAAVSRRLEHARVLRLAGVYATGLKIAERSLATARELGYPPTVVDAHLEVAGLRRLTGDAAGAAEALEDALVEAERWGLRERETTVLIEMIRVQGPDLGRLDEADRIASRVEAYFEHGVDDPARRLQFIGYTAQLRNAQGRHDEALALSAEAEATLAGRGPSVELLETLAAEAVAYEGLGALEPAVALQRRVYDMSVSVLGLGHPRTAVSLSVLANLLLSQQRVDEAAETLAEALSIQEGALGPDHLDVAKTLTARSRIYIAKGEAKRSLADLERARTILEKQLGPHHAQVANAHLNVAASHGALGDMEEVLRSSRRAQESLRGTVDEGHQLWIKAMTMEATALVHLGRRAEARTVFERALEDQRKLDGAHPRLAAAIEFQLADVLVDEDPARARRYVERARSTYRELGLDDFAAEAEAWLAAHPAPATDAGLTP